MFRFRLPALALSAVLASSLVFAASADARKGGGAGPGVEPTEAQKAVHSLKHDIAVLELFNALQLSADQKTALSGVVTDVVAVQQTRQAERAENAPRLQALLTTYLTEVKRSGEPSAKTLQALSDMRAENKPDREGQRAARQEVKAELGSVLSEEQVEVLRSFRPMAAAGPSDEDKAERHEQRRERLSQRAEQRGVEGERAEGIVDQRMERSMKRRGREMGRHNAKKLLFSQAMLDLLD